MDTGTVFLLSIIAVTAMVTWILNRPPSRPPDTQEVRHFEFEEPPELVPIPSGDPANRSN
jgi:hypothetical protein